MEKSFFFNAVVTDGVPDRSYSAEDFAEREARLLSDGIIGSDSLEVIGTGSNGVYISPGAAVISGYTYLNTEVLHITLSDGDSQFDRIDTVSLKLDLGARKITAVVTMGYPASQPTAYVPAATATVKYLPLAEFTVPAGGAPTVETDNIRDLRTLGGYASSKNDLLSLLSDYLGGIDPLNKTEVNGIRRVIATVTSAGSEDEFLCGDGTYRTLPADNRAVAVTFTEPGTYTFDPADYPSADNLYDIEVQGAGGAGGSHNGTGVRGGGGGAGAFLTASKVCLARDSYTVTVGKGGTGVPGGSGEGGEPSSFGGFIAAGGCGGGGGSFAFGGSGGMGMCSGENGADGTPGTDGIIYTSTGKGGASMYGDGAPAPTDSGSVAGNDAEHPGAGGSGGTALTGTFSMSGGAGGNGRITVWRYIRTGTADQTEVSA